MDTSRLKEVKTPQHAGTHRIPELVIIELAGLVDISAMKRTFQLPLTLSPLVLQEGLHGPLEGDDAFLGRGVLGERGLELLMHERCFRF